MVLCSLAMLVCFCLIIWLVGVQFRRYLPLKIVLVPAQLEVATEQIVILSLQEEQPQVRLEYLPAQEEVIVPGGYGQYPLRSVAHLLQLEQRSSAEVASLLSFALGYQIDEVWLVSELPQDLTRWKLLKLAFSPDNQRLNSSRTSSWGALQFLVFAWGPWQYQEYTQLATWQQVDHNRDQLFECSVSVINTTRESGLALQVASVLERSSMKVNRVDDRSDSLAQTMILTAPEKKCAAQIRQIKALLPVGMDSRQDAESLQRYRGELTILLGTDVADYLR